MLLLRLRIHQHIIDEHYHELVKVQMKHLIHQIHESCRSIHQTKWHHEELVVPVPTLRDDLVHVLLLDPQLIVPRLEINLQKHTDALKLIKQIINLRQMILALDGHTVQHLII